MFAIHIVVPIAAILVLGIIIARGLLHSSSGSPDSIGQDLVRLSQETVVEGVNVVGQLRRPTRPAKGTLKFKNYAPKGAAR